MDDAGHTGQSVLVVDDEAAIAELVATLLETDGMRTCACTDPYDALARFGQAPFDLAILDVMMPRMDGFELCARLRETRPVPVIFLTARDDERDVVAGFSLGAEDYVTKPFRPRELVVRVRARLRDGARPGPDGAGTLRAGDVELRVREHRATLHGEALPLTPKEFAILTLLAERAGEPVAARDIFERAWGERFDASAANTVMVHIRHLRTKLAAIDGSQDFVETVWGVGYRLRGHGERGGR